MKKLLALLIACLALTVAACGDDDDDDGGGDGAATTTEQTDTGAAPPADEGGGGGKAVTVDIPSISFEPAEVTVKAGTTITWTNSDDLPHTVTKDGGPGGDFDSGNIEPGDEFELTADVPGTVDYVCTIHPGQEGSVTVE
jgi:plastocyanin